MKMKRVYAGLVLICLLLVTSCNESAKEISQSMDMTEWLEKAGLNHEETREELYRLALSENTLVVYSNSSRVFDVKRSFEAEYPGLTVEIADIRSDDIVRKLQDNYKSRNYVCDVVINSDNDASLTYDLLHKGMIYQYVPWDIKDKVWEDHRKDHLMFMGEAQMLFYNTEIYEKCPVSNWWELTEEQYKGKVYMPNPLQSFSTFGLLMMVVKESDAMAQAYLDLYGKVLDIPEGSSAGEVFLERLIKNAILTNTSDEVTEFVGSPGQVDPPFGIMISSKVRMSKVGYKISPAFDIHPFAGIYGPNCIMMAGGAKNIHSAKLFIRWVLGETDGTGEGALPFRTEGTWSARTDIESGTQRPLSDIHFLQLDKAYIFSRKEKFKTTWLSLLEKSALPEEQ